MARGDNPEPELLAPPIRLATRPNVPGIHLHKLTERCPFRTLRTIVDDDISADSP